MLGVLVLVLVFAAALAWWLHAGYKSTRMQAATQAHNTARLLETRVLATLREVDLLLADVARESERLPMDPPLDWAEPLGFEAIMALRDRLARQPSIVSLSILDGRGRIAYSSAAAPGQDFSDQPHLQGLLRRGEDALVVSPPYLLRTTGQKGVAFARPVRDQHGRLRAIVMAGVQVDAWGKAFEDLNVGERGALAIYDNALRVVARQPLPSQSLIGSNFSREGWVPTGLLAGTYFVRSSVDGEARLLAERAISAYPFQVGAGLAEADYLAGWHASIGIAIAALLFISLLGATLLAQLWRAGKQARVLADSQARLAAREQWLRSILEASPSALGLAELDSGRLRYANPDLAALLGVPLATLNDLPVSELFMDPEDWPRLRRAVREAGTLRELEFALRRPDGSNCWGALSATLLSGNGERDDEVLLSLTDVTARHARELRLEEEAGTDPLTGLANRRRFFERGGEAYELAQRHARPMSLLMLDIDHFKQINDSYGHPVGDQVLVRLARLLETSRRQGDLPARLGGEEFAILLPETPLPQALEAAERIREAVENAPLTLDDSRMVPYTVSIGVAEMQSHDQDLPLLLIAADAALYRAKDEGRNRVVAETRVAEGSE